MNVITIYLRQGDEAMASLVRNVLLIFGIAVLSGCFSVSRTTCAAIGGVLGGVGGGFYTEANTNGNNGNITAGAGIGTAAGGVLGALLCKGNPEAPNVSANATPPNGEPPLRVQFGSQASDPDGKIVSYAWDFGDGGRGEGPTPSHSYSRPGRYAARVTVTDNDGLTASAATSVEINAPVEAAAPKQPERRIVLQGITFAFNSAKIGEADAPILDVAAEQLQASPSARVSVIGHTDSVGGEAYNQKLSERRAEAVVQYLANHGIDRSRLEASGAGESQPVASNDTADGRAQNRRVELKEQ